jgi:DNA polymerase elongation subunit (family B)
MYIDAFYDHKKNLIRIVERHPEGRKFIDFPAEHVFYYTHPAGTYRSMHGESCKRYSNTNPQKFRNELGKIQSAVAKNGAPLHTILESDINPVFRALETHYKGANSPVPNVCFFDIETGFDDDRGFAPVDDPFNPVTAITIYLANIDRLITVALCPPTLELEEAIELCRDFPDTFIFDNENDLLTTFCDLVDDVDVLSGWNSETYDVPYLVNRINRTVGDDLLKKLCLWDQYPRPREVMKYGKEHPTYDFSGRVHLDYLALYQKHNPQQQHSYRLDFIGEIEVGENKIPYEGTLDDLYKKDFYKFIEYSRQDVALLVKIDQKKKFLELANQIAHVNCVLFKTTMGSVALVEQAIMLEIHEMGLVAPNRRAKEIIEHDDRDDLFDDDDDDEDYKKPPVVGAYVAKPKVGLHSHIGAVDINSLYPSAIRALNISPETIVGQIRSDETKALVAKRIAEGTKRAEAWDGIFATLEVEHMMAQDDAILTVDFDNGETKQFTGAQLYEYIFNPKNNLCISANGTIFKTDRDGVIPLLLAKWYKQRKEMQGMKKIYSDVSKGVGISDDLAHAIMKEMKEL